MARARGGARRTLRACLGDKQSRRHLLRLLALCATRAALLALPACPAWAEKWDVVTTLSGGVTHTDNVSLAQDATKQSAWIAQITPGISITATGARVQLNVNYAPEFIYYSAEGQKGDQVFQRGNADVRAELARRVLFIDAGARVNQHDVSLQGPLTTSNINTTGNRTTVKTFFLSPYLRHEFGSDARGEARFTYSDWSSDSPTVLADNESNRIDLRLASGPAYQRFTWDTAYRRETIQNDETLQENLTEAITENVRWLITPTVGLLGLVGYERYDFGNLGSVLEGSRWGAGLEWTPTPRTRLAATAGKRFDENTYSFDFRHRRRLTTWSANYSEDVTTSRSDFFVPATTSTAGALDQLFLSQVPDPVARQKAVEEFISRTGLPTSLSTPVNFFSDQLFLVKRWQASVALQGVRNTLVANAFTEMREVSFAGLILPGTGDFAASNSIRQTGASLAWNWRATARTAWTLSMVHTRSEFPASNRVDDLTYAQIGLARQLQPRLTGSLYYRWRQNDSSQSVSSYTENAAGAILRLKF